MTVFLRIIFYSIASGLFIVSVYEILDKTPLINEALITNLCYLLIVIYFIDIVNKMSAIILFRLNKNNYLFVAPLSGKMLQWQHTITIISLFTSLFFSIVFYHAGHLLPAMLFAFAFAEKTVLLLVSFYIKIYLVALNDNCILIQQNRIKTIFFNAIINVEQKYGEWFFILKNGKVINIRQDIVKEPEKNVLQNLLTEKLSKRGIRLN
jgi:hypothetical protein